MFKCQKTQSEVLSANAEINRDVIWWWSTTCLTRTFRVLRLFFHAVIPKRVKGMELLAHWQSDAQHLLSTSCPLLFFWRHFLACAWSIYVHCFCCCEDTSAYFRVASLFWGSCSFECDLKMCWYFLWVWCKKMGVIVSPRRKRRGVMSLIVVCLSVAP